MCRLPVVTWNIFIFNKSQKAGYIYPGVTQVQIDYKSSMLPYHVVSHTFLLLPPFGLFAGMSVCIFLTVQFFRRMTEWKVYLSQVLNSYSYSTLSIFLTKHAISIHKSYVYAMYLPLRHRMRERSGEQKIAKYRSRSI